MINLLPRNKFDFERVHKIKKMNRAEIVPLLPGLLEWIQDMNWAIAPEVTKILLSFPKEIVPHIKNVLKSNDDIWKFWCLEFLVKELPLDSKVLLKKRINKTD